MYNPLNVYVLVRHVAIGWPVVEQALNREKQRQEGAELPKRVRRLLARSKRDHVPGADDLDGVAVGIVRLHDYYKFNASSFVDEGVFETDEWKVKWDEEPFQPFMANMTRKCLSYCRWGQRVNSLCGMPSRLA